jgi:hypothetical protein
MHLQNAWTLKSLQPAKSSASFHPVSTSGQLIGGETRPIAALYFIGAAISLAILLFVIGRAAKILRLGDER